MSMDGHPVECVGNRCGLELGNIMTKLYIGTYHEDGKEPVIYSVDSEEYTPENKERLLILIKQCKRNGYWTIDE